MQSSSSFIIGLLLATILPLHGYQPYTPFIPTPQAEIGLNKENSSIIFVDMASTVYTKLAHETFLDNLRVREPLSALTFNKSDFRMSQMFQDCKVPTNTEFYNPYIRVLPLHPRISFSEIGTHLTLRAEAGFGAKKWLHIGVKASSSFKRQVIERRDTGSRGPANTQDLISKAEVRFPDDAVAVPDACAYRLDFIEALPDYAQDDAINAPNGDFQPSIVFNTTNSVNEMEFFSQVANEDSGTLGAAFVIKKEGYPPRAGDIAVKDIPYGSPDTQITGYLPKQITQITEGNVYEIGTADISNDYSGMLDSATKSVAQRIADQDAKAKVWVVGTYDSGSVNQGFSDMSDSIVEKINQYNDNEYEWFHDRGHVLESQLCQGIGDTTLETYLAADLFDSFQVRIRGGAVLPTARQKTTGSNPYALHLGNRGHVEFFIGGGLTLAIPHTHWFITTDMHYITALSASEYISATPRGALIKNMGPETQASISWHSAQGNVWLHMQHPKATNLSCAVGYEWYSKIEDTLLFVDTSVPSFLGRTFNPISRKYDIDNFLTLDPEVAKNHTGAISHTLRFTATYAPSPYLKITTQTGYVVAGRNIPQTIECSIGCIISF